MTRRATLLLVGTGVLVVCAPVGAASPLSRLTPSAQIPSAQIPSAQIPSLPGAPTDPSGAEARADEQVAASLLGAAVTAGRSLAFSGTQHHATWRRGQAASTTVAVRHVPGLGLDIGPHEQADGSAGDVQDVARALEADVLDETSVELLMRHYALTVAREGGCAGRRAVVVDAVREQDGERQVAGRFWVDRESGLLLRREVYDGTGRTVRSTAFLDVQVAEGREAVRTVSTTPGDRVAVLGDEWPQELPGEFVLVEARERRVDDEGGRSADVLHLAYSDGLSSLSLFAQPGRLDETPGDGFREEQVAGGRVWVRGSTPERVVWSGGGQTWTLLSDAPVDAVRGVVAALPHDPPPDDGLRARLVRGAARAASWINPFG